MGIVPSDRLSRIQFYENHLQPWGNNAANIGLTPTQVTGLTTLTAAARAAYNAAEAARQASRAATQAYYDAVRTMHSAPDAGQDMIDAIKYYAESKGDPNVYVLAEIPAPAVPSAAPPPGTPFAFTVGLEQTGALELKWKCNNPAGTQGTIYEVRRRIGPAEGSFTFIGASGVKSFIDNTLPDGAQPVTYQITAVRSTARGKAAAFLVTFGVGGGGAGMTIASIGPASGKVAA